MVDAPFLNAKLDLQNGAGQAQSASVNLQVPQPLAVASISRKAKIVVSRVGGDVNAPVTVSYHVGVSAVGGLDYQILPGAVTIQPGATAAKIKVKPIDRPSYPANADVLVTLIPGAGYSVGDATTGQVLLSSGR